MRNIKINVENIDVESIKSILWKLCYNPEEAMEDLNCKVDNPKELINLILEECRKSGKKLNFGDVQPCRDTYGIDLGIRNNVVRDVILERCYTTFASERAVENSIEKVIKLLKTQDDDRESYEKRVFGGLRALGFGIYEAQYLKDTCNLYPVGLFLEKLVISTPSEEDFEEAFDKAFETEENQEVPVGNMIKDLPVEPVGMVDKTISASLILENQKLIELAFEFIDNHNDISSVDEIAEIIARKQKEISVLQEIVTSLTLDLVAINGLEEKGIPFGYVIEKQETLKNLFSTSAML